MALITEFAKEWDSWTGILKIRRRKWKMKGGKKKFSGPSKGLYVLVRLGKGKDEKAEKIYQEFQENWVESAQKYQVNIWTDETDPWPEDV